MPLTVDRQGTVLREVARTILLSLPAHMEVEITFLISLARSSQDSATREACAEALRRAQPHDTQARTALEAAQTSGVVEIEEAVRAELRKRSQV